LCKQKPRAIIRPRSQKIVATLFNFCISCSIRFITISHYISGRLKGQIGVADMLIPTFRHLHQDSLLSQRGRKANSQRCSREVPRRRKAQSSMCGPDTNMVEFDWDEQALGSRLTCRRMQGPSSANPSIPKSTSSSRLPSNSHQTTAVELRRTHAAVDGLTISKAAQTTSQMSSSIHYPFKPASSS
jgi:hypothetical protein